MLKGLKTMLSKNVKPIMTKGKHDNYLTSHQTEQLKILDELFNKS